MTEDRDDHGAADDPVDVDADERAPTGEVPSIVEVEGVRSLVTGMTARLTSHRPTRTQIGALLALSLLLVGPLVALVATLRSDPAAVETLAEEVGVPPGGARMVVTVVAVNPTAGELRARIVLQPEGDLLRNGRPTEDLTMLVNDQRGQNTTAFPAGQPIAPVEVSLPLTDGSITRYPFDAYDSELTVLVTRSSGPTGEPTALPLALDLEANANGFVVSAEIRPSEQPTFGGFRAATFAIDRTAPTRFYATWIMVLMFGLAATGVLIIWSVVVWQLEVPWWIYGFFVGVLFALPPLRSSLPGNAPLGVLFDYVSYYWAVTIIGLCLIVSVVLSLSRERPATRRARIEELAGASGGARSDADETRTDA